VRDAGVDARMNARLWVRLMRPKPPPWHARVERALALVWERWVVAGIDRD
jgi:hypothetical protein